MNSEQIHLRDVVTPSQGVPPQCARFPFAILFCVWMLVFIVSVFVTAILPEAFVSTARVRIERDHADIGGLGAREPAAWFDPYYVQTELEAIQSELVLRKVIENLDLNTVWGRKYANGERLRAAEALALLKGRIALRPVRNTCIVEIRCYSERPDEAAKLANAVAEAYRDWRVRQRAGNLSASIRALEEAYDANNQKARAIQTEIAELSRQQNLENSNRLSVARRTLEDVQGYSQVLFGRISGARMDLSLPAMGMVQIVDAAVPSLRPIRPNKALNTAVGVIVGGLGGLFLATLVYGLQILALRRRSGAGGIPFPPRFRAIVHILIALVVGLVVGYYCAEPLSFSTVIVVPLILLLGASASAYIELARPVARDPTVAVPHSTASSGGGAPSPQVDLHLDRF